MSNKAQQSPQKPEKKPFTRSQPHPTCPSRRTPRRRSILYALPTATESSDASGERLCGALYSWPFHAGRMYVSKFEGRGVMTLLQTCCVF